MSRAIGMAATQFIGARVAGRDGVPSITYILAHIKNGKTINQRCNIPVYINSNKGTSRDGTPGRSDRFRLVAWGKMADICAKSLSKGKAFDAICSPHSYEGRTYDAQGNMRVDNTGQPITTEKVGFTIERIVFGEESQKEVELEIQTGRRPINWNVLNHPDHATWQTILQTRKNAQYTGGDIFGFAKVIIPSGPGITLMTGRPATTNTTTPVQQIQPVQPGVVDQTQLLQLLTQVLQSNQTQSGTVTAPVAPQPTFQQNVTPVDQQAVF